MPHSTPPRRDPHSVHPEAATSTSPRKLFSKQIPQTNTSFFFFFFFFLNNLKSSKPVLPHMLNLFTCLPLLHPPLIPELHETAGVERSGESVAIQHGLRMSSLLSAFPLQWDETPFFFFVIVEFCVTVTWLRQERGEGGGRGRRWGRGRCCEGRVSWEGGRGGGLLGRRGHGARQCGRLTWMLLCKGRCHLGIVFPCGGRVHRGREEQWRSVQWREC